MRPVAKLCAAALLLAPLTLAATGSAENILCASTAPANHSAPLPAAAGGEVTSTSASSAYGSSSCHDEYVVEATQVNGRGVRLAVAWGEPTPGDSITCSHAFADADLYVDEEVRTRTGESTRRWRYLEHIEAAGQWSNGHCAVHTSKTFAASPAARRYRIVGNATRGPMDGQPESARRVKETITAL